MFEKVLFADDQQLTQGDLRKVGDFPQEGIDLLISSAIEPGLKFSGFETVQAGAAQVVVGAGVIFASGRMFYRNDDGGVELDFLQNLPAVAKKIVTVVGYGTTQQTATEPRTFLIDVTTRETEARSVATIELRYANVDKVIGSESTNPVPAGLAAGYVPLAYVTLGPTGILAIDAANDFRIQTLKDLGALIADLNLWRAQTGAKIETIQTDVSALAVNARKTPPAPQFFEVLRDVAQLKSVAGLPAGVSSYGYEPFLALAQSESDSIEVTGTATNAAFDCRVEEGVRAADTATSVAQILLLNPDDVRISVQDSFVLPAFTEIKRITSVDKDDEISISAYENQTVTAVQKQMSAMRIRYGKKYKDISTNTKFWATAKYDPATGILSRNGITYQVLDPAVQRQLAEGGAVIKNIRIQQCWVDYSTETYWTAEVVSSSINGSMIAQSFLMSQESWATALGLYFTRKGNADVPLVLCECDDNGAPNLGKAVAKTTLAAADIKLYPLETKVPLAPTLLARGRRYAFVPISTGDHYLAVTVGNKFNQGNLFTNTGGSWSQGDQTKDAAFVLYCAQFASPRVEVQLQPWTLAGGIYAIDIAGQAALPSGCSITYEVKGPDNLWKAITDANQSILASLPVLVQARVVLAGTTDLMPRFGVATRGSVTCSKPKLTAAHVSTVKTPPASVNTIYVDVTFAGYDAAHHTLNCRIRSGAGYTTLTSAGVVSTTVDPDNSGDATCIRRRYAFTFGTPITSFKIQIDTTTDNVAFPVEAVSRFFAALTI